MTPRRPRDVASPDQARTQSFYLTAGTAYGLVFGIGFALAIWGYDAILLSINHVHLAWAKLILGMVVCAILCGLAGRLVARSSSAGVHVAVWLVVGVILGLITGHMPFEGNSLAVWLFNPRVRGLPIFPFGDSAAARTVFVVMTGAALGMATGFIEYLVLDWAWDRATPRGGMSVLSWLSLLASIPPILILMLGPTEEMVNGPTRTPTQRVGQLIRMTVEGATEQEIAAQALQYRTIAPFVDSFSDHYSVHMVKMDDFLYAGYVDVVFDNGMLLRCFATGPSVGYCDDFGSKYEEWMGQLIHAGLTGERLWLEGNIHYLQVDETLLPWLATHGDRMSESYQLEWVDVENGWIFVTAHFDTGFDMTCRFSGMSYVLADQCSEE